MRRLMRGVLGTRQTHKILGPVSACVGHMPEISAGHPLHLRHCKIDATIAPGANAAHTGHKAQAGSNVRCGALCVQRAPRRADSCAGVGPSAFTGFRLYLAGIGVGLYLGIEQAKTNNVRVLAADMAHYRTCN